MVEFVHSDVWIICTIEVVNQLLFTKISSVFRVKLFPPLDVIRLNMTCGAAYGNLCLSLCYEKG